MAGVGGGIKDAQVEGEERLLGIVAVAGLVDLDKEQTFGQFIGLRAGLELARDVAFHECTSWGAALALEYRFK